MSKRNKVLSLILVFAAAAHIVVAKPAPVGYNPAAMETKSAVKAMKSSTAWVAMETQLDQYDTHHIDYTNDLAEFDADKVIATNKIALVTDPATKLALNKIQNEINDQRNIQQDMYRMIDDCHDALVKLIKCFKDYVEANNKD